jgi:hypothetical protein
MSEYCISNLEVTPETKPELIRLKQDAKAAIKATARLIESNPNAKESYERQLAETLRIINKEADRVAE